MTAWLKADPVDGVDVLLDVNLANVARIVGRCVVTEEVARERGDGEEAEWVLEVGYLSGGSDTLVMGTRADVERARDAIFDALSGTVRRVHLAEAIARRATKR